MSLHDWKFQVICICSVLKSGKNNVNAALIEEKREGRIEV